MKGPEAKAGVDRTSLRFPHRAHLLKHAAFEKVYGAGKRIFSPNLTIFYRWRNAVEMNGGVRVGFTVSRALGAAVTRNRIRRRLRQAVRLQLAALTGPVDVVINPKRTVLKAGFTQLVGEVERAFAQIQRASGANAERAKDAKGRRG